MKATLISTLLTVATLFAAQAHAENEIQIAPTNSAQLVGVWNNVTTSSNIVRIVIRRTGTGISVQPYGSCTPTPCNHGVLPARVFSPSVGSNVMTGFNAFRNFGFKSTSYIGILQDNNLVLTTQNTFKAGDTRYNYTMMERFARAVVPEPAAELPSQQPADHSVAADVQ